MIAVAVRRVRFALAILVPAAAAATIVYVARPEPETRTVLRSTTVIAPVPVPLAPPADPPPALVARGACEDVPALVRAPTPDDDAAMLADLVTYWTTTGKNPPPIVYRRGVAFAESAEDLGDDPAYPKSAAAESRRACGTDALWLRSALRDVLAARHVVCDGNVCCYGGRENGPAGYVAFEKTDDGWTLDAWAQTYDSGPYVTRALKALAKRGCPGEPAGARY